jgi:hypothetical protein
VYQLKYFSLFKHESLPGWRGLFFMFQNVGQTVSKNAGAVPSNINITFSTAAQYVHTVLTANQKNNGTFASILGMP